MIMQGANEREQDSKSATKNASKKGSKGIFESKGAFESEQEGKNVSKRASKVQMSASREQECKQERKQGCKQKKVECKEGSKHGCKSVRAR